MIYPLVKNTLFLFPPETAHRISMNGLHAASSLPFLKHWIAHQFQYPSTRLKKTIMGLEFPNPVGLGAGFDKNAEHLDVLALLGFGFIEIGTVTPLPQEGNPKPRLFRLKSDAAIINRMGFNNEGVAAVAKRLAKRKMSDNLIIGGNIGKNKITPNKNAVDDYVICFNKLFDYVDYFVVNVSSPNTPNLRELQEKKQLFNLLNTLQELNNSRKAAKPILLKIAPDLNEHELKDILWVVKESGIAGIISSNTTIDRSNLRSNAQKVKEIGAGGLSGKPVLNKSNAVLHYLNKNKAANLPIIAVGGIHSASDAVGKLNAGADLVQLYTGFVYEGPQLIRSIRKAV